MTGIVTADKEPVAFWEQARDFLLGVPLQILAILLAALIAHAGLPWVFPVAGLIALAGLLFVR